MFLVVDHTILEDMTRRGCIRSWTDEELIGAVRVSRSRRQVIIQLGLQPKGGNYAVVKQHIQRLELDVSHFLGMGWNKGGRALALKHRIPTRKLLVDNSTYQSHKLRQRLVKEGYKKECCELCGWHKKAKDGRIPLELDHINGKHSDNRLENLRILCPNCHSLQDTHRGKNKNKS